MAAFVWSAKSHEAAELLAAGQSKLNEIAAHVGIPEKSLYNWRLHPEFADRVRELTDLRRSEIRRVGIAESENRLALLQRDIDALERIQRDRGEDARKRSETDPASVLPGEETGLLIRGPHDRPAVDTKLIKARQQLLIHAAREMGQWGAKSESSEVDIARAVAQTREAATSYVDPPAQPYVEPAEDPTAEDLFGEPPTPPSP